MKPTLFPNCDKPTIEFATEPPETVLLTLRLESNYLNSSSSKINFIVPFSSLF